MPDKEEILKGLQTIVDNNSTLAIIWHIVFYFLLAALIFSWRPSNKILALILCLPAISVSLLSWTSGNPFNGLLFAVLAVLIIIFGLKASATPITVSEISFVAAGIIMIAFGIIYPHFVSAGKLFEYLYASPAGLIPCPTLSIIIGIFLVYNGLASQSLTLTLAIFGLFYGIFGVLKLGVYIDVFLIAGAAGLLIKYFNLAKA